MRARLRRSRPLPSEKKASQPFRHTGTPSPETVDPKWLLKAFALTLCIAAVCGYATLCLLFYHGQWQLVLHPGRQPPGPPPTSAQIVHFGPDATAIPQLTGWWIPAAADAPYRRLTLLYLRGADGSLSDDATALAALHTAGLNLLAFNYRGYPAITGQHPSQEHMTEDAEDAWQYLLTDRHIPPSSIIPYGVGVGASLVVHLAGEHGDISALILDAPRGDLLNDALHSHQSQLVPVRLLFNQQFPLAEPLAKLPTPKLILSRTPAEAAVSRHASDPKFTVELPSGASPAVFQSALSRFLDQYLPPASLSETGLQTSRRTVNRGSR